MEDNQIVDLYWRRDEDAIQETGRKYTQFCFGIAWNILFNKEDSEECVNDTWFAAWKYIPPQRPVYFSAFLGKITRGFAIDCLRKKSAAKRVTMHIVDITEELENLNHTLVYTLDSHMEEKELVNIINGFLHNLAVRDRDIFIRRYWYADSIRDIAERHNYSISKIKSNLFRTRKKLLRILEEWNEG